MLRKKGFTLVEMLFVVVIALCIVAFAVPAYKRTKIRAQYDAATGILFSIQQARETLNVRLAKFHPYNWCMFPVYQTSVQMPVDVAETGVSAAPAGEDSEAYVCSTSASSDIRNKRMARIMFDEKLLEPFKEKSEYVFYAIGRYVPASAISMCNGKCKKPSGASGVTYGGKVAACMCLPDSIASDPAYACFYGARMYDTGPIERFTYDDSCAD